MKVRKYLSASYEAEITQIYSKSNKLIGLKKTEKTLSNVCSSYQSLFAKCYVFGFESELSRQSHNTYHDNYVITNI